MASVIAAALQDMDELVEAGMRNQECDHHKFEACVKYGDDGMGDVKTKKGRESGLVSEHFEDQILMRFHYL